MVTPNEAPTSCPKANVVSVGQTGPNVSTVEAFRGRTVTHLVVGSLVRPPADTVSETGNWPGRAKRTWRVDAVDVTGLPSGMLHEAVWPPGVRSRSSTGSSIVAPTGVFMTATSGSVVVVVVDVVDVVDRVVGPRVVGAVDLVVTPGRVLFVVLPGDGGTVDAWAGTGWSGAGAPGGRAPDPRRERLAA